MSGQAPIEGPPDRDWIITAGYTRRLIAAPTLGEAQVAFITLAAKGEIPGIKPNTVYRRDELRIREATEVDLAEFAPRRRIPKIDGQLDMGIDVPTVKRRRANAGDHA